VREETIKKVTGRAKRSVRTDSPVTDETEIEKSFWISRPGPEEILERGFQRCIHVFGVEER
jgi:hypothetical protein